MPPRHAVPPIATAALVTAVVALVPATALAASGGTSSGGTASTTSTATAPTATAPVATAKASGPGVRPSPSAVVKLSASRTVAVRKDPARTAKAGTLRNGATIRVRCQVNASAVSSNAYGRSKVWDRVKLANGRTGYLPDVYLQTSSKDSLVAPYCGYPDPPAPTATNPQQGRCNSVATVPLDPVPATRAAFVATAGPLARASQDATGVPAAVTLAQGILESGSGLFTAGANNYFGIKAQAVSPGIFSWGPTAVGCVHKQTDEVEGGVTVREIAEFRMYTGMRGSFDDHGNFLRKNSRYAPAFAVASDPEAFAKAIAKAGYATDPSYSAKLIALMNAKDLPLKPYGV